VVPVTSWWRQAGATQAVPPLWVALVAFTVAVAAVRLRPVWRVSRYVLTVAHEGGHAVVGRLFGRRLTGIHLHSDTSGLTVTTGRRSGLGMVATSAAGYLTPSLLGLAAAWLLAGRHVTLVLWLSIAFMAGMVLALRNAFGLLTVALLAAALLAAARWGSTTEQGLLAWSLTWFLLLGTPRTVWELHRECRRRRGRTTDADQLAALTHLPAQVWVGAFAIATLACLLLGGRWLLITVH
jgi:hypothetical protein